ncbi:MAG: hypothetical protein ACU843_07425 [Gammaproteobacteria bacterium]
MQVGTNWGGDYSRFSYDELKQYMFLLAEQGAPQLDDEINVFQETILNVLRRSNQESIGEGTRFGGFQVVGTGATNDFTIKGGDGTIDGAGRVFVAGYPVTLSSDTTYSGQPVAQSALTTPAVPRIDEVYIDAWLDEVDPVADPSLIDPVIGFETSRRLGLNWAVKVAEGTTAPAAYTDANNLRHYTLVLAAINRTASPTIDAGMVSDTRYQSLRGVYDPRVAWIIQHVGLVEDITNLDQGHTAILESTSRLQVVHKSSSQALNSGANNAISWDSSSVDEISLWNIADPTKMVIPSGYTMAKVTGCIAFDQIVGSSLECFLLKNGAVFAGSPGFKIPLVPSNTNMGQIFSGWVPVTAGDYLEFAVLPYGSLFTISDAVENRNFNWFAVEVRVS